MMKNKTYYILLIAVVAIGILTTALLVGYTVHAYLNASIIAFLAREVW